MKLKNSMEQAVRIQINRLHAQATPADETCWCPLCRADTMALALSSLTPRYATRRPEDVEANQHLMASVNDEVAVARTRVGRFPKHAKGGAVAAGAPVWVVNYPLEESFRAVDQIVRDRDDICDCWHCRCDVIAFALNRYPARYGVEHEGRTHLFDDDRARLRTELATFLELAVRVVMQLPRHESAPAG